MSDNIASDTPVTYKAQFTLTQVGVDGPVHSKVVFTPLTGEEEDDAEAPEVFAQMSAVIAYWLELVGMVNERGELINEDEFLRNSVVTLN